MVYSNLKQFMPVSILLSLVDSTLKKKKVWWIQQKSPLEEPNVECSNINSGFLSFRVVEKGPARL